VGEQAESGPPGAPVIVIERDREGWRDGSAVARCIVARDRYIWLEVADPAQS